MPICVTNCRGKLEIQIESGTEEQQHNMLELSRRNTDELLLVAGGYHGFLQLSGLDSYSPFQDLKRPLATMNFACLHASAANLNGELYVFGGVHGSSCYDTGMLDFLSDFLCFVVY